MVFNGAIQGLKNNSYHSQEVLAATLAAMAVKFGSKMKFFNEITAATAATAGFNTAGLLVGAKSVHTYFTAGDADEKGKAWKLALLGLGSAATATMLRATTVLQSKHTSLPKMNEFAKPLAYSTLTGVVLAEGGIRGVKWVNARVEAALQRRAERLEDEAIARDVALLAGKDEAAIQGLSRADFIPVAEAGRRLLATAGGRNDQSGEISDEQIGWINDQAATFVDADAIPGWVNLAR